MHTLDEKERFLPVVSQVGCVADRPWDLKAKTECYRGLSPPACYRLSSRNRVKRRISFNRGQLPAVQPQEVALRCAWREKFPHPDLDVNQKVLSQFLLADGG